jgi:hypothetical protein
MTRAACVYQEQDGAAETLAFVFAFSLEEVMPVYELGQSDPECTG